MAGLRYDDGKVILFEYPHHQVAPSKTPAHLGSHSKHFQRRRHVKVGRNPDVAEVREEGLAPDAKEVYVEHSQGVGQCDDYSLAGVTLEGSGGPIFVRNNCAFWARGGALANPEVGI